MIASLFPLLSSTLLMFCVRVCLHGCATKTESGSKLTCKLPVHSQRRKKHLHQKLGYICLRFLQFRMVPAINNHLASFPQSTLPCSREDEMGPKRLNMEEALQQISSLSGQGYPHTSCRWCLAHTTPAWEHPSKQAQAWFVPNMPKHSMVVFTLIKCTGLWAFGVKTSLEKGPTLNFNMFFFSKIVWPSTSALLSSLYVSCVHTFTLGEAWPLSIAIAAPAEFKRASLLWINVALISPPPHALR